MESQEAEEGGSITLHCELSKPGLPVEWKRGTQVLTCGEKYQMKQKGFSYELQILDLRPEDTGNYSCSSEDTTSSASIKVNGRMEIHLIDSCCLHQSFIRCIAPYQYISSSPFETS